MAGQFPNNLALESITIWAKSVNSPDGTWEGNNIHIDEVSGYESVERADWIKILLEIISLLTPEIYSVEGKYLFLNIPLNESPQKLELNKLDLIWLNDHLDAFTPPSFNYTSVDYFNDFYFKELTPTKPSDDLLLLNNSSCSLKFYYRNYWDERFSLYLPEIYIFIS